MNKIFHIVNGSFHANLDSEHMHEMLLPNWRKMTKLAVADWRNDDTLRELNDWFTQSAQDAQQEWKTASQAYAHGWKDPKTHGREVLSENRRLTTAVKAAKKNASLAETAGTALTGGTNGAVDGTAHQKYLDKIEPYTYNTMGVVTTDETTKSLYAAFVKRMREDVGAKFQCVLYGKAADYEGVINVKNRVLDEGANEASLVYWVTGAEAACAINKSLLNVKYDGAYTVDTDYKQSELETFIKSGVFAMHNVSGETCVLSDINSFVSDTEGKSKEIFGDNQCVRVMDQIANDIAVLFNTRYLGKVPNDASGRVSLWNDIVKHHQQLEDLRAIENFSADDVQVEQGDAKNSVAVQDAVTIVCAMAKLYMTVTVS